MIEDGLAAFANQIHQGAKYGASAFSSPLILFPLKARAALIAHRLQRDGLGSLTLADVAALAPSWRCARLHPLLVEFMADWILRIDQQATLHLTDTAFKRRAALARTTTPSRSSTFLTCYITRIV